MEGQPAASVAKPAEGKKPQAKKEKKKAAPVVVGALPDYAVKRLAIWNDLKAQHDRDLAAKDKKDIEITLPDGKVVAGKAWETTPFKVAEQLSKTLVKAVVVARVNGEVLWDLGRPLEDSCRLELLKWDAPEARDTFWHSSAHILGQALERVYQGFLCTGPPIAGGGFFYDMGMDGKTVSPNDFPTIQKVVDDVIKEKQPFEMMRVPKEMALEMFGYSPFKTEILTTKVPDSDAEGVGAMCSVYRCGNLVDLCRGPHILDTGRAAAFQVWKSSSSYWKGDAKNATLQRVYGISFPEKKLLDEWQKQQEALEAKSHTAIGTKQQLFFIEPQFSPGSTFWLPHGARIYNKLIEFIRGEYVRFGFTEVITPNMFNNQLWTTSGHFPKYEKDMFILEVDKEKYALKPMNCFPVSDHQLLTSKGFMFHDQVVASLADPSFMLASYNAAKGSVVFDRPERLVYNECPEGGQELVEFAHEVERVRLAQGVQLPLEHRGANSFVSLVATADHNMFARSKAGSSFALQPAGSLVSANGGIHFLTFGENGECVETPAFGAKDVRLVRSFDATWCATMPSGYVVVRRAKRDESNNLVAVSRPTVQGNCPGHCLMFRHLPRSHRELPIRFADFGVLHRNEESGALKGLTRVRRFQQDDAHIFCSENDIGQEIRGQLEFMKRVYGIFGYEFSLELSTRPENYLGEIQVWDKAESTLVQVLDEFGHPWGKDVGGGAFYGPKIDVKIKDSLGRQHQCATVQLDFQLPIRFELEYVGKEKNEILRPVMIHRAIYGSLERFIGILIEHLEGKWPLWLSPRQLMVIAVNKKYNEYAESVQAKFVAAGFFCDIDLSGKTMDKKILEHSLYNYILVVGAVEEENKTVNVRKRKEGDEVQVGREREVPVADLIAELSDQVKKFQ